MAIKQIVFLGLIILSGCANIRHHVEDVFLYQQKIMLAIVGILNTGNINEEIETILYSYEDKIGQSCHALQEAGYNTMYGKEISTDLKTRIVDNLDICENSVQEAEAYLITKGFKY